MCSSLLECFIAKKFFLVIHEILRSFFNTLPLDDKYSLSNTENVPQPIQMQLSKRLQIFFQFFTAFLKSTFNFQHCEEKDEPDSVCISEVIEWERRVYVTV